MSLHFCCTKCGQQSGCCWCCCVDVVDGSAPLFCVDLTLRFFVDPFSARFLDDLKCEMSLLKLMVENGNVNFIVISAKDKEEEKT